MYLAWKEITHEKRHFALITAVITLVGIMVFFLTGLAVGLQAAMSQSITNLKADNIIVAESSNNNIQASLITTDQTDQVHADARSALGFGALTITHDDDQITATVLAMDPTAFTAPPITTGHQYSADNEVVADSSLQRAGYSLGDTITTAQRDAPFTIVGFTTGATYAASPVIYMNISDWQSTGVQYRNHVSAVATRGDLDIENLTDAGLSAQNTTDFINSIPGVTAQNLTFGLMIGALVIVAAVILGIFIYVLTLQKKRVFGVMKTQGISNRIIGWSVVYQTLILSVFGSVVAVTVVVATGLLLPDAVPFTIPWILFTAIGASMVVFSLLGALFSVRSATSIDPLIALQ